MIDSLSHFCACIIAASLARICTPRVSKYSHSSQLASCPRRMAWVWCLVLGIGEARPRNTNTAPYPKCEFQPKFSRALSIAARCPTVQIHRTNKGCMNIVFLPLVKGNIFRRVWRWGEGIAAKSGVSLGVLPGRRHSVIITETTFHSKRETFGAWSEPD